MLIQHPKPWLTVVTVSKVEIERADVMMAAEPVELMSKAYVRLGKPTLMINGGFFNTKTGETASNLKVDGVTKGTGCSKFGLIKDNGGVRFGDIATSKEDSIGGTPSIVKDGKVYIDESYGKSFNEALHPRSAVGESQDNIYLVTVDGRQTIKGIKYPGMTLQELAEFMISIGCQSAINLDGGGSTRIKHNGKVINTPCENRPVDNFLCFWLKEEKTMGKKVFIDVGHGGSDPGAQANGLIEKNLNLTVGLALKQMLIDKGFNVQLSREVDTYLSLTQRTTMANDWGADCFISIHHNAGGGDGWETIHTIHTTKSQGDELATAIGKELTKTGQNMRRMFSRESENYPGQDYYTVIQKTKMAAVITEFAFLDTVDYKAVDTNEELIREAQAICSGICNYYGVVPNDVPAIDTEAWKNVAIEQLTADGIINDKDKWIKKRDENIPVWAAYATLNKVMDRVRALEQKGKS